jgi:two-component system C4-dicarboxylate transport sensor histidine kinase DctB
MGSASLMLLDRDGRIVGATDRSALGAITRNKPFYINALRSNTTVFTLTEREAGGYRFMFSRRVTRGADVLGVIVVEVDLRKFETHWAGISEAVLVTDSTGRIILSTEPRWRGLLEADAVKRQDPQTAILRAIRATADWTILPPDAYVQGEAVMRMETRIPFHGWRIASFTTFDSIRARVNGVIALEIMVTALVLAFAFYVLSRRTAQGMTILRHESDVLRDLNARLKREIAEREKMQKNLEVAEQSLAQSSKLAALGEMSAAVSHELNQPLAAMKTYLAGARLLLDRNRPDEAVASFGRIDGLIERMGAITRQLKSYARKGGDDFRPVEMADALQGALSMMEPQLRQGRVQITQILPDTAVVVFGDQMRIEQVMVNLLRNALDATKSIAAPEVEVILSGGDTANLTVRDNGCGVDDFDTLFEPFYTTKQPGDGVGLGLAISSGIATDLGGRLIARHGQNGGAVFELELPTLKTGATATD